MTVNSTVTSPAFAPEGDRRPVPKMTAARQVNRRTGAGFDYQIRPRLALLSAPAERWAGLLGIIDREDRASLSGPRRAGVTVRIVHRPSLPAFHLFGFSSTASMTASHGTPKQL